MRRAALVLVVVACLMPGVEPAGAQADRSRAEPAAVLQTTAAVQPAAAVQPTASPSPSPTQAPPRRDMLTTIVAVLAIVVAGAAGLWIYRVIRKGL